MRLDLGHWRDGSQPWNVKLARASVLITELRTKFDAFMDRGAWSVIDIPIAEPDMYRVELQRDQPIPLELGAIVGDIVHNLRSSLDTVAYALARRDFEGEWTDRHEIAPQFPIVGTPEGYEKFFTDHKLRDQIYSQADRDAMRAAQSFYYWEQSGNQAETAATMFETSQLYLLNELSNTDKHRRIPLTFWHLDLLYWENWEQEGSSRRFTGPRDGDSPDTIGYLYDPQSTRSRGAPTYQFVLAMEGRFRTDFIVTLEGWHRYISGWAVPRIFQTLSGDREPTQR
ncbi:hypothetical protein [Aeromicrobium wangtongii]|uniref:hypothetical protein n=1 Tax=Aeromicrobium wangtongii TaxID=2969247 RepID=UPI002017FD10|nr:hypothetical protein [Aeromicrobium wangtongii]MCL3818553.1 hypothetical protein [Aeromicrobium wangtongii]